MAWESYYDNQLALPAFAPTTPQTTHPSCSNMEDFKGVHQNQEEDPMVVSVDVVEPRPIAGDVLTLAGVIRSIMGLKGMELLSKIESCGPSKIRRLGQVVLT